MLSILLIDDNPDDRMLVTRQLQQEFSQIEVTSVIDATGFKEALLVGNFDLAILDYQLRWSDGLTVLNAIKAKYPDCPVIMCTDSGSEEVAVLGMKSGLSDYVRKGKLQRLALSVRQSLEEQRIRQEYAAAVEQLQVSEDRLRLALEAAHVGTWDWNIVTSEVVWSENHERLLGLPLGSFEGTYEAFLACIHPEDRELVAQTITKALETKTDYNQEFRVLWSDGSSHWIVSKGKFSYNTQGQATRMIGVVLDISDRKQREEELEQTNRLKDEFLAIVSHELRTPLNAILGWAKLLRSRQFDEKTRNRSLEIIERNAIQQNQLIDDILDTSRLMRGQMQLQVYPVNLVTIIENALNTVRLSALAQSITLEFVLENEVGQVMGEEKRLQQVVWNLLSNAIKFTDIGGKVEVRLEAVFFEGKEETFRRNVCTVGEMGRSSNFSFPQSPNSAIRPFPTLHSPSFAQITVSDTGIGINPNFLPYVFDRFRQADSSIIRSRNGLGLGLAIVKQLVELHGGTVSVQSQGEGEGATFTVLLPLINERKHKAEHIEASSRPSSLLHNLQVLAVDDDTDNLELMVAILQAEGAKVTAVSSADAALQILKQIKPDVLVSDIGMYPTDGYTLIRQVRLKEAGQSEKLPAIALTAYASQEDKNQVLAAGFEIYLRKPVAPVELVSAISSLVSC